LICFSLALFLVGRRSSSDSNETLCLSRRRT
jgi:hypothetical protein